MAPEQDEYINYPEEQEIANLPEVTDEMIDEYDQRWQDALEQFGDGSPEEIKAFRLGKRLRYHAMYLDRVRAQNV
ncbi:hypothetical protein C6502_01290 [Candidatus Poribacteria bacterium]|nr:MAG: hypothetical protein C6502_01290 [Candidatus Poribacteria bacterium]